MYGIFFSYYGTKSSVDCCQQTPLGRVVGEEDDDIVRDHRCHPSCRSRDDRCHQSIAQYFRISWLGNAAVCATRVAEESKYQDEAAQCRELEE